VKRAVSSSSVHGSGFTVVGGGDGRVLVVVLRAGEEGFWAGGVDAVVDCAVDTRARFFGGIVVVSRQCRV